MKKTMFAVCAALIMAVAFTSCSGKKGDDSSSKNETEKVKMLSHKKVPAYLKVEDYKSGTWVTDYNASIIPENLTIPNGIAGIDDDTFKNCELLESVKIPGSVKTIDVRSFMNCTSLASVALTKGLEKIGGSAFENCTALKSITIPEGGVEIRGEAFEGCTALASVTIAKDVSEIGYNAFKSCTSLKEVRYKNTQKRFKLIANKNAFEKDVVIHCTDGDYVFGSDAE